jgi:hypothetical protein
MISNNETPSMMVAVRAYRKAGGRLQWIAQVNCREKPYMREAIDEVVDLGCKAMYIHGALTDRAYDQKDDATLRAWCEYARSKGVPVGVAAHNPRAHLWVNELGFAGFHTVCFFHCGSIHVGKGERFSLDDLAPAVEAIQTIRKPCIAYKVLGAGRIDARMGLEYAFQHIKPTDVVNLGMHRGDKDGMVEENVKLVEEILGSP